MFQRGALLIHTLCTLYILQCTLYIVHSWHFVVLYFIIIPCRTVLSRFILYHVTIGNMLYYYIVLCQTARRNAGCEQVCDGAGPSLRVCVCGVVHIPCDSPSQVYSLGHSSYRCTVGLLFIATGEPRLAHSVAVANKVMTSGARAHCRIAAAYLRRCFGMSARLDDYQQPNVSRQAKCLAGMLMLTQSQAAEGYEDNINSEKAKLNDAWARVWTSMMDFLMQILVVILAVAAGYLVGSLHDKAAAPAPTPIASRSHLATIGTQTNEFVTVQAEELTLEALK
jgi:hypothetical protein